MAQDQPTPEARGFGRGYAYVGLGFTLVGAMLFFGWLGWLADGKLATRPLLTILGGLFGGAAGFYRIYRQVVSDTERDKRDERRERGRGKGEG